VRSAPDFELQIRDGTAPRVARRAVAALLGPSATDPIGQAALLSCSELINNVVMHAGEAGGWLSVWWIPQQLIRLEVEDTDPGLPDLPAPPAVTQLHGRGLHIVDTVASRWGMHHTSRGKTIWCEFDVVTADSDLHDHCQV
jgi:serine/threonine-protein kinase RsbW